MINRRELLRFFGAGATISPVVGGEPLLHATARLIEPPKIDIITASDADMPRTRLHRLEGNAFERLWLARWRHEEAQYGIIEHLLGREPTQDERSVVAALVQWFGTNCGLGFIHGTFRAEGYYLESFADKNPLRELHSIHPNQWPEFVTLRMKNGPPEIL